MYRRATMPPLERIYERSRLRKVHDSRGERVGWRPTERIDHQLRNFQSRVGRPTLTVIPGTESMHSSRLNDHHHEPNHFSSEER